MTKVNKRRSTHLKDFSVAFKMAFAVNFLFFFSFPKVMYMKYEYKHVFGSLFLVRHS